MVTRVSDALLMRRALEYVKAFDGVIAQHAQEPRLTEGAQMHEGSCPGNSVCGWPAVAEEAIIARDVPARRPRRLAAAHLPRQHCRLRGDPAVGQEPGISVTAEVTPHHLLLTDQTATTYDPIYKVNPPLRSPSDVAAVREALAEGIIDIVATDHTPRDGGQRVRVGGGVLRDARPADGAAGRQRDHGPHRSARLDRGRGADVDGAGGDRPGQQPWPPIEVGEPGQPHVVRSRRRVGRAGLRHGQPQPQHPVRGDGFCTARFWAPGCAVAPLSSTASWWSSETV